MMRLGLSLAIAFSSLAAWVPAARCGEVSLPDTAVHSLRSHINGVKYKLYVSVPTGYDSSNETYPVLYLLDADYSFPIARAVVQHLSDRKRLKPLIVVGIAYAGPNRYRLNRTRDYTPTHTLEGGYGPEYQRLSGGAPRFLRFIREELIPWVDRSYRTVRGDRGLVGHSYGGLFASWVFLTAPDTFSHYVIVSPSLWYDGHMLFTLEKATSSTPGTLRSGGSETRLFFSVGSREGNGEHDMVTDLQRFVGLLRQRDVQGQELRLEVFNDDTHDSVFPAAFSRGLRSTFGAVQELGSEP